MPKLSEAIHQINIQIYFYDELRTMFVINASFNFCYRSWLKISGNRRSLIEEMCHAKVKFGNVKSLSEKAKSFRAMRNCLRRCWRRNFRYPNLWLLIIRLHLSSLQNWKRRIHLSMLLIRDDPYQSLHSLIFCSVSTKASTWSSAILNIVFKYVFTV